MFSTYDFSVMFLILAFVIFGTWLLVKRAQWFELLSNKFDDKSKDEKHKKKDNKLQKKKVKTIMKVISVLSIILIIVSYVFEDFVIRPFLIIFAMLSYLASKNIKEFEKTDYLIAGLLLLLFVITMIKII